jgi:hypothetical protein
LIYWSKVGSADSSKGFCKYLYLIDCPRSFFSTDKKQNTVSLPPNELVQHIDVLLQVIHRGWLLRIDDGPRARGSTIIDVVTTRLEKTTNEKDLEKSVCIFEEFELRTCLDKFVCEDFEIVGWYCF